MEVPFDSVQENESLLLRGEGQPSVVLRVFIVMKDPDIVHVQVLDVVRGSYRLKNTMFPVSRQDMSEGRIKFFLTQNQALGGPAVSVQSALESDDKEQHEQEKSFRAHHR